MPRSSFPSRRAPSQQRDQDFASKFLETQSAVEAYRSIGLGTGNYHSDHSAASRMLKCVKPLIARHRAELAKVQKLKLEEKMAILTQMALDNFQGEDRMVALGAIRELNRMEGDYAPTKHQTITGLVQFVQNLDDQTKEKPIQGEIVPDREEKDV